MMPFSPSATDLTAPPSVTMEKTTSEAAATAAGVSAHSMPCSINGAARSAVLFHPVTR